MKSLFRKTASIAGFASVGIHRPLVNAEVGLDLAAAPEIVAAGVVIAPGIEVAAEAPTTIGLGDAFIGGVVAHLAGAPKNLG